MREADFHRLFTDEHVTRLKFYTDQNIDLLQRILGGIPLILFAIAFISMVTRFTQLILRSFIQATPWAVSLCLWGVTFFLSQLSDKSDLNDIYYGRVLEEMPEFCASGYVLLAIINAFPVIKNSSVTKNY